MKYVLLFILATNSLAAAAYGPVRFTITGRESAEQPPGPLIGANVYFETTNEGATTDIDGVATLQWHDHDSNRVIVSYLGFLNDTITLKKGQSEYVVELQPDIQALKHVDVVAKQNGSFISELTPAKTEKITGAELKKAACCNLSESFQSNSSVDVNYQDAVTGAKEIKLLGLSGLYVQNLLEAQPFLRGLTAMYGLDHVPAPWIKSISVSKGVPSVKSGYEGITGSMNIDLKHAFNTDEKWYIDAFGNQNGRLEFNTYINHKLNDRVGTMLFANGAFIPTKEDMNMDMFLDQPRMKQYNLANRWNFHGEKAEGQYMVKVLSENRIAGQTNYDPMADPATDSAYGIDIRTKRVEAFAKTGFILKNNNASIGTQLSGTWHQQDALFGRQTYDGQQGTFSANILYQTDIRNPNHTWVSGVSFLYDNWQERVNQFGLNRANIVPGVFAEYTYRLPGKLTLVAGLRADHSSIAKFQVNPRLHLKYNITEKTILFVAGGKGFRVPSILTENQSYLASSRVWDIREIPDVEAAWNYGLSLVQKFDLWEREGSVNVDFFRTDFLRQAIADIDQANNQLVISNLDGKSFSNSLLVEFNFEVLKGLDLKAAYRFEDVRTTYHGKLLLKPLQARQKGLVALSYKTPNAQWQFDLITTMQGKRRLPNSFEQDRGERFSPRYVLMNAQVLKVFRNAEVFLGCENLTNFTQKEPVLHAMMPGHTGFDATQVWGPTMGYTIYGGFRYHLKD